MFALKAGKELFPVLSVLSFDLLLPVLWDRVVKTMATGIEITRDSAISTYVPTSPYYFARVPPTCGVQKPCDGPEADPANVRDESGSEVQASGFPAITVRSRSTTSAWGAP
jgi:hypothetical protein